MRPSRIMKMALLCAALVLLSRQADAQTPVAPMVPPAPMPAPQMALPPAGPVVGVQQGGPCCQQQECCAPTKKICVAAVEKKPHTEIKYRCKCKTICLPNCHCIFGGKCGSCDHSCEATCDSGCQSE